MAKNTWTSCTDRLPQDGQRVLGVVPGNEVLLPGKARFEMRDVLVLRFMENFFAAQPDKADAHGRWLEGCRLSRKRDQHRSRTGNWEQITFTDKELEVLQQLDGGELLRERNLAILDYGHGQLRNAEGKTLDIGGSTAGESRRVLGDWCPPDWAQLSFGDEQ